MKLTKPEKTQIIFINSELEGLRVLTELKFNEETWRKKISKIMKILKSKLDEKYILKYLKVTIEVS